MMQSGIYVIVSLRSGKVYVGKATDFEKRWANHRSKLNNNCHVNQHLQNAWNKYGAKQFQFKVLEYCYVDQLNERETHHVKIYRARGIAYNLNDGGTGGSNPSEETRRKISEARKGKVVSEETRHKMSEALKGNTRHKGKTFSEETRHKLSISNTGRIHTEETRRKISEARNRRPPISEETRRKIGEANKRRPPISEETRRKLSEAAKHRYAKTEGTT